MFSVTNKEKYPLVRPDLALASTGSLPAFGFRMQLHTGYSEHDFII